MVRMKSLEMKRNEYIWTKQWMVALVAILCCALWGSAFPAIKLGYQWFEIGADDAATQILFAGCRFTMAGILTIIFGSVLSKRVLKPKKSSWKRILVLSFFQTSMHYVCFYIGLAHTSGVKSSILNGMNTFMAILLATYCFKQEKMTWGKAIGSVLGFVGIVLVNLNGDTLDFSFHLQGEGFIILSTFCYGMSSALIRIYGKEDNSVMLSGYQFSIGGIVMMILGWFLGGRLVVWNGQGITILIYLAFLSSVAYTLWALLLRYNDVSKVTIYGFFNPVFGALLSAILLGETGQSFGGKEIIALVCISSGIYVAQKSRK